MRSIPVSIVGTKIAVGSPSMNRRSLHRRVVEVVGLSVISVSSWAQSPVDLEPLKETYKEEPAVILENRETVRLSIENGDLQIRSEVYTDQYLINDQLQNLTDERIYYNETFDEILSIEAKALIPNKNQKKYRAEAITSVETKSKLSNSVFYHDNYYKEIIFPKLQAGSRTVIAYQQVVKDPHFLGSFYFSSVFPTLESEYSIQFPKTVKIRYKVFNDPESSIAFESEEVHGETRLTWRAKSVDKFEYAADAPPPSYYVPHLAVYIEEYTVNGKTVPVLSDVQGLYNWYRELIQGVNSEPSPVLASIADSLTKGLNTDREKVEVIYRWVQENIKYVAFEDGMSGFIPREAAKVCTKRYGDCKDMASITTELLKSIDIPAHLTWIGSRDIPYTYSQLPTPAVDNHMIAAVELDGEIFFLDATDPYIPLGMPSSFIQGKEALIGLDDSEYRLHHVPVMAKEKNRTLDSTHVAVQGDQLTGTGKLSLNGYSKVAFLRRYQSRNAREQQTYLERRLELGHNKFRLKEHEISNTETAVPDLTIDYAFEIPAYAKSVANSIYVNLNLDKTYASSEIEVENREKLSREQDYKSFNESITVLEIPEGYQVNYLPESIDYQTQQFGFTLTYSQEQNRVVLKKSIFVDALYLEPEHFEAWNVMIEQLNQAYKEAIVLKKIE